MNKNDFKTKKLVFDKYIVFDEVHYSFNSELKSLIDEKYISVDDALKIIFELMYCVINYDYNERDVDEEFKSLIENVKEYNLEKQIAIKNAVLFFKDYSYEKDLFVAFSSNLNIDDEYKNEIDLAVKSIGSNGYSGNSVKQNVKSVKYSHHSQTNMDKNSLSRDIRERMDLDKEIRMLSRELRKKNPYNWRELLKESSIYKMKHGLEIRNPNESNSIQRDNVNLESKKGIKKTVNSSKNENNGELKNELSKNLSEKEVKKLKIRSSYLSNKIKYSIKNYSNFIREINSELNRFNEKDNEDIQQMINQLNSTYDSLKYYQQLCDDFNVLDRISETIKNADNDIKIIKNNYEQKLLKVLYLEYELQNKKFEEYTNLIENARTILNSELAFFSQLNSRLNDLMDNAKKISKHIDKNELLNNLEDIHVEFNEKQGTLNNINNKLDNKNFRSFISLSQADNEINILNEIIDELKQLSGEYFEEKIIEQEKVYMNISFLNDKIHVGNTEKLLNECEKCFNRPMFKRQLKKYNLDNHELDIIKNDVKKDIINHLITDEDVDFKKIIKTRCREFRKDNSAFDENKIDNLLDNVAFSDIDEYIIVECKNKVKKDLSDGNITINHVELKLKNYVNKKIIESNQLKELDIIKNNPNVPSIKIHLTQEENDEIYRTTETEILSEYGINGSVENRVYYWVNQKIRDNQSLARGRLSSLKREFSNLIQLSKKQQKEFVHQMEFYINENKLKPYDITEENIVKLSENFKNNGKLKL